MISYNKKTQNIKFYFSQDFRNKQIRIIFKILKLPVTNENSSFINNLLINNNNDLYKFYFPKKPFYISNKEFLTKLGNKGIVETSNQIIELLHQKEIQEQKEKQEQINNNNQVNTQNNKTLNEELTRPKFSSLEYSDDKDPDEILSEKIKERRLFDKTIPNFENHKTPEEVGLVPIQIKKKGKNGFSQNSQIQRSSLFSQNEQKQTLQTLENSFSSPSKTINRENNTKETQIQQEQNQKEIIQPLKEKSLDSVDLNYHNDDFKPEKPTGKIDFSQPIDKSLLMENINEGMEDHNYSAF